MNVCIETNWLYVMRRGCARYVRGLLLGLAARGKGDIRWHEVAWPVENMGYRQPTRALKTLYREFIWSHTSGPSIVRHLQPDILHVTSPLLMHVKNQPLVSTLYDFAMMHHPERFRPWTRWRLQQFLPRIRESDAILCISRFTADEAVRYAGVPASRLHVTPLACSFTLAEAVASERPPDFLPPEDYYLFVGALEPGKNLALLQHVYALAKQRQMDLAPLVVVGERMEGVRHEGAAPANWIYTGHITDEQLMYLYRRARAYVYPTKYEGFGLPVLEAMTLGCPVICSPLASLPEVGGDAVLYADQDPESYLDAMRRIGDRSGLRAGLIASGFKQAALFSWERCAEETVAVYRDVLAHRKKDAA